MIATAGLGQLAAVCEAFFSYVERRVFPPAASLWPPRWRWAPARGRSGTGSCASSCSLVAYLTTDLESRAEDRVVFGERRRISVTAGQRPRPASGTHRMLALRSSEQVDTLVLSGDGWRCAALLSSHRQVETVAGDHHRRPGKPQQPPHHDVGQPVVAEEDAGEADDDEPDHR
jgi:hypothetical protein